MFICEYLIRDMEKWRRLNADLIITDPPFGIQFTGKSSNYNRNSSDVVDGYVEWDISEYENKILKLLYVINNNLSESGQALVFSGWNNSNLIHNVINDFNSLTLQGKLYWVYNFAPYCTRRPAHNVYEIYWLTKSDWFYNNKCSYDHCQKGEANLSVMSVKRDYKRDMPKYPTRLPLKLILILLDHFSKKGDLIFDPLAGSGIVGIASEMKERKWMLGDINKNGKKVFKNLWEYLL